MALPTRQRLRPDDLLLQSRHKTNLQDLFRHQVDSSTAGEILTNDDDLQSILLASQLRGHDDSIRKWVSEQGIRAKDIFVCERPDVDGQAANSMWRWFQCLLTQHKTVKCQPCSMTCGSLITKLG